MRGYWLLAIGYWLLASLTVPSLQAQRGGGRGYVNGGEALEAPPNPRYDGRFTYARIRYTQSCCVYGEQYRDVKWGHDYPRADMDFPKILQELSTMRVRIGASVIVTLDDPELFKFPFVYLSEPGYWLPSEQEATAFRNYLLKGGFAIIDDFEGSAWYNFEEQMKRVLPGLRPIPMTSAHPIFDSFYRIEDLSQFTYRGNTAKFFGFFEDNDLRKRLMAIVNYDYDVSEYWEHSAEGFFPIALTNTAYKLGVNYAIYSLSR